MISCTFALSQVSKLVGLAPATLNARVNTLLKNKKNIKGFFKQNFINARSSKKNN